MRLFAENRCKLCKLLDFEMYSLQRCAAFYKLFYNTTYFIVYLWHVIASLGLSLIHLRERTIGRLNQRGKRLFSLYEISPKWLKRNLDLSFKILERIIYAKLEKLEKVTVLGHHLSFRDLGVVSSNRVVTIQWHIIILEVHFLGRWNWKLVSSPLFNLRKETPLAPRVVVLLSLLSIAKRNLKYREMAP